MISIAIDGPSGAGKSTLAKSLAEKLGYLYVDTGAIYRTIGLYMYEADIDPKDEKKVMAALPDVEISLSHGEDGLQRMNLNDCDVTEAIRLPHVSLCASAVSAHPGVREFLLEMQRELARTNNVIMDGRDIGTVILPDAEVKIFLTASPEARAKRRLLELQAKGDPITYEELLAQMRERDENDSTRKTAPAIPAEDAVFLDNSDLTAEETVAAALRIIRQKTEK